MLRRPPISTRTASLFPSTTLCRCRGQDAVDEDRPAVLVDLVLDRLGVLGDLDDDVDFFGDVAYGGDVVEAHGVAVPAQGAARRMGGLPGGEGVGRGILRRGVLHCRVSLHMGATSWAGPIPGGRTGRGAREEV